MNFKKIEEMLKKAIKENEELKKERDSLKNAMNQIMQIVMQYKK